MKVTMTLQEFSEHMQKKVRDWELSWIKMHQADKKLPMEMEEGEWMEQLIAFLGHDEF